MFDVFCIVYTPYNLVLVHAKIVISFYKSCILTAVFSRCISRNDISEFLFEFREIINNIKCQIHKTKTKLTSYNFIKHKLLNVYGKSQFRVYHTKRFHIILDHLRVRRYDTAYPLIYN